MLKTHAYCEALQVYACLCTECGIKWLTGGSGHKRGAQRQTWCSTCGEQVDGVDGLDVGGHVLDPALQVVARVVAEVVGAGAVCGDALDHIQLVLAARLVHEVVPKDAGVLPVAKQQMNLALRNLSRG